MKTILLSLALAGALLLGAPAARAQDKSPPPVTSDTASATKAVAEIALTDADLKAIDDAAKVQQDADRDAQQAELIRQRTAIASDRAALFIYAKKLEILNRHKLSSDEWDVVYLPPTPGLTKEAIAGIEAKGGHVTSDISSPGRWVIQKRRSSAPTGGGG